MTEPKLVRSGIDKLLIGLDASVLETMKVIDQGASQIALVVSDERNLVGVMTDGDLRRAILGGATLDSGIKPFVNNKFRSVSEATGRSEALELMQCFSIEQLPIVNEAGAVVGLHLLNDLIRADALPNAAMILAGGKGTRLGKLTKSLPKPMIKVAGRPILERIVLHLVGSGIQKIYLSTNYLSEVIESHFEDGSNFGCSIEYLREDEPLGTGGPLSFLRDRVNEPLLVMNGDLVAEFSVREMFSTHQRHANRITVGVRTYTHEVPYGCMELDGTRVSALAEKPILQQTVNTGIYVFDPVVFSKLEPVFTPITSLIEDAIAKNDPVGTFFVDEWIDVGQPDQLSQARGG